jgi:Zn-dependent protease
MAVFSVLYGLTVSEHLAFVKALLTGYFGFLKAIPAMLPDTQDLLGGFRKLAAIGPTGADPGATQNLFSRFEVYWMLVSINVLWGLINLLPIWPLDGGQVAQTVLSEVNPYNGRRWTHIISLLVAAMAAIYIYSQSQSLFNMLFFAYFAVINYQMLDAIHRAQSLGLYEDDR